MKTWKAFAGATTLAALFTTSALADVTNREVWDSWRTYMGSTGLDISASENTSGNTLTVSDLILSMAIPEGDGSVTMDMGQVQFRDQGDGTVLVIFEQKMPITVLPKDGNEAVIEIDYTGMTLVVSGDPSEMTYTYSAAEIGAELVQLMTDGAPSDDVKMALNLTNMQGRSTMAMDDLTKVAQKLSAEGLNFTLFAKDPDGGDVDMTGSLQGVEMVASSAIPLIENSDDPVALFNSGFAVDADIRHSGSQMTMNVTGDDGPFNADISSGSGTVQMTMSGDQMSYDGTNQAITLNATGAEIPLPLNFTMEELSYGFAMPMLKQDGQQDFRLSMTLGALSIPELLWGMADPGGMLSHEPATVSFDLAGKVTLFADLVDEQAMEEMEAPGELNSLTLNSLLVELIGAKLSGMGGFTFDNTDMATFDGMPRPEGAIDLNLKGANKVIDTLVEMGLLPEEQAMTGRMMMSMFAVPGDGPDDLNSRLEINADGHVLANGQRIQ
nr:DUF2125 domain-containing protein [uncultured Shimia sp.]